MPTSPDASLPASGLATPSAALAPAPAVLPPSHVPRAPFALDDPPGTPALLYTPYGLQPWVPRGRPWWRTWLGALLWALVPALGLGISVVWVRSRNRPETFVLADAAFTAFVHIASLAVATMLLAVVWWLVATVGGGSVAP